MSPDLQHQTERPLHLQSNLDDWPIAILSARREAFKNEIVKESEALLADDHGQLITTLRDAVVLEMRRIKNDPWHVDPPNEKAFWTSISSTIREAEQLPEDNVQRHQLAREALRRILNVYAEEIAGKFKPSMFKKARVFCNMFFSVLCNRFFTGRRAFWGGSKYLHDKIKVIGSIDHVRQLYDKGTLVFLPTHSSNLDSLLLGYALDYWVGVPSSHYGAGLNLFNSEMAAYFMNRLGAYRVDRRKKNKIYLETLKSASRIGIRLGVNSLFFTGGTRSRSGEIEQNLKLGLLGTAVQAQRKLFSQNQDKRVFIVPVVMSYSNVLEDNSLFRNYLSKQGLASLVRKRLRKKNSFLKTMRIFGQVFKKEMSIYIALGQPLDVFGNLVNKQGRSVDKNGVILSKRDYFLSEGILGEDTQREMQYTRHLAATVATAFRENNVVRLGQLTAAALLRGIKVRNKVSKIEDLLKLAISELAIPRREFNEHFTKLCELFRSKHQMGECLIEPELLAGLAVEDLIHTGLKQLRTYQIFKVVEQVGDQMSTDHLGLLVYYANRLECYFEQERQK